MAEVGGIAIPSKRRKERSLLPDPYKPRSKCLSSGFCNVGTTQIKYQPRGIFFFLRWLFDNIFPLLVYLMFFGNLDIMRIKTVVNISRF